VSNGLTNARRS